MGVGGEGGDGEHGGHQGHHPPTKEVETKEDFDWATFRYIHPDVKYDMEKLKELAEKMMQLLERVNMVQFLIAGDLFRAARIKAAALKLAKINPAWLRGEGKEELRKLNQDLYIELL